MRGIVTEEFSYYCLQVGWMQKLPFQQDVRYMELWGERGRESTYETLHNKN